MKTHPLLQPFDLTDELKEQLKAKYGKLFLQEVAGVEFVFRQLFKEDWDIILKVITDNPNMTNSDLDDKVVDLALIGPRPDPAKGGWVALPAGIPTTLSMYIRSKSGFIVPELQDQNTVKITNIGSSEPPQKPTDDEIDKIKKSCPFSLSLVGINDDYFIIRPITRQEWRSAVQKSIDVGDETERDLEVVTRAVLWPKKIDWNTRPAGYTETLANYALGLSGYNITSEVKEL